ncbi:glycoside hydrolase family 2 protein [Sunxiuqinia sp. sy24]|uniref:glycoside hydrolase family 2 protein n=1 Tax=Sunxiuqinia sp. sy24 TaxID=3461495 RepID=UPI004046273B
MRQALVICLFVYCSLGAYSQETSVNNSFEKYSNQLCELPTQVTGVQIPVVSLNGHWQFSGKQLNIASGEQLSLEEWENIQVPGEPAMQGFMIEHDAWYAYKKVFTIPSEFAEKKTVLRFNGVYSHAKVWVNGTYLREHWGGFTSWECDLTPFVKQDEPVELIVAFLDPVDDISFGSGYAKHCIGGILRDVELIALPEIYVSRLEIETELDNYYEDAKLKLNVGINKSAKCKLVFELRDEDNILLFEQAEQLEKSTSSIQVAQPIENPHKWTAEKPYLYSLTIKLKQKGTVTESIERKIGFRKVEVKGNKMLVNGMPVKLRGACRHDIHPLLGRTTNEEYDLKDVMLAKEANMNYIRTSHYPPSRKFLEYCDKYGIYVEDETAVCFVKTWKAEPYSKEDESKDDPAYTDRYLGQLAEMIENDRNHPSVVIWSIGNENRYGENFGISYDYVVAHDTTRPIMFSYPGTTKKKVYDIASVHYVNYDGELRDNMGISTHKFGVDGMPALHDEWAHVACYNVQTLKEDPGVRDFWGQSMEKMWTGCFDSDGGLGGAIWGMIDEIFMLPDTVVGYGQWGFIDTWRRKKPEFWHTKKAHTPVKLESTRFEKNMEGRELQMAVLNRFDHTNLSELKLECNSEVIEMPDIAPHHRGKLIVPAYLAQNGTILKFWLGERLVDMYRISFQEPVDKKFQNLPNSVLNVVENDADVTVSGEGFSYCLDKQSGLIKKGMIDGVEIIKGGPFFNVVVPSWAKGVNQGEGSKLIPLKENWSLFNFAYEHNKNSFTAHIKGQMDDMKVTYFFEVLASGEVEVKYTIEDMPEAVHEAGINFLLSSDMNRITWNRNAQWSVYPENHIGRPVGTAVRDSNFSTEQYRVKPQKEWEQDGKDFYLFQKSGVDPEMGMGTNDFRTTRLNLTEYQVYNTNDKCGLYVFADGELAARCSVAATGEVVMKILHHVSYSDLGWGNYVLPSKVGERFSGRLNFRLSSIEEDW